MTARLPENEGGLPDIGVSGQDGLQTKEIRKTVVKSSKFVTILVLRSSPNPMQRVALEWYLPAQGLFGGQVKWEVLPSQKSNTNN